MKKWSNLYSGKGDALAEWSMALLLRETIKRKPIDIGFATLPGQSLKENLNDGITSTLLITLIFKGTKALPLQLKTPFKALEASKLLSVSSLNSYVMTTTYPQATNLLLTLDNPVARYLTSLSM